jgi:hypothetical protein
VTWVILPTALLGWVTAVMWVRSLGTRYAVSDA